MGLRVGFSTPLLPQRSILLQQAELQRGLARLSAGLRLNTAADNPAGLAISERLRARIGGVNAAVTNASRSVDLVRTAEGALTEINMQLGAIRGLAVQAGNSAVLGDAGVQAIQQQIDNAIGSINRIAETTEFAGRPLLNGTFEDQRFAIAEGNPATLTIPSVVPEELGRGVVNGSGFESLADIDVTTPQGAADALAVVDAAINDVSRVRADLGAFQTNTLETAARTLRINRENLIFSESVIRDTNYATEVGNSELARIRLEAGIIVQSLANNRTGIFLDLLA